MIFEHQIFHQPNLNLNGTSIIRNAVRAVIVKDDKLFMVYLNKTNEYKFPGGGIDKNETYEEALIREVKEETGASVKRIGNLVGRITEYNREEKDCVDYFKMVSTYYEVEIDDIICEQKLETYEKNLGFMPRWVNVIEAESTNKSMISKKEKYTTRGIVREAYALQELNKYYSEKVISCV